MKTIAGLGFMTFMFLGLAYAHIFIDSVTVDAIAILLLILAVVPWILPWAFPYIKSIDIFGVKIDSKDVQDAIKKVTSDKVLESDKNPQIITPQLALIALRIDIEKLIRSHETDIGSKSRSLSIRIQTLANENILSKDMAQGILEIIKLGNSAAHGAVVEKDTAEFVLYKSKSFMKQLETQLKEGQKTVNREPPSSTN